MMAPQWFHDSMARRRAIGKKKTIKNHFMETAYWARRNPNKALIGIGFVCAAFGGVPGIWCAVGIIGAAKAVNKFHENDKKGGGS